MAGAVAWRCQPMVMVTSRGSLMGPSPTVIAIVAPGMAVRVAWYPVPAGCWACRRVGIPGQCFLVRRHGSHQGFRREGGFGAHAGLGQGGVRACLQADGAEQADGQQHGRHQRFEQGDAAPAPH
ncbi:hypothetical protein [Massilia sp. Se16.2.3]|uniref:hypothetical protein n=1 Tax=Massilia sp. Se16.2.3 TaxID=2709303 RepID=UPI0015FFDB5C|nr:hypothetical protein [Massilia sp. Se16.2.3]QNB00284.1 hypothetical protein G4G31_18110 [Massilia sp. Se16.2.3]